LRHSLTIELGILVVVEQALRNRRTKTIPNSLRRDFLADLTLP
jgi:hypothetical protein